MDRLVIIEPRLVVLNYEIDEKSSATISLQNVMHTMPVAFKVQSSSPSKYTIKPPYGIIAPLGVASVEITILPQAELPDFVPYSQDKFVVKSVVVPGGKENEIVCPEWFTAKKKQVFSDHGMKVIFVGGAILRKLVAKGCIEDIREVLELDGRLVDLQDEHGCTAMHVAVASGRPEVVPLLLEFMANLEVKNVSYQTALHEAAAHGELLVVELLLARGARTDVTNSLGWTPLHSAVVNGHAEMVRLLAQNRVDLNAVALDGRTALHMAVDERKHACLETLLEKGADVDAKDGTHRDTPLHRAATKGDNKAMDILLKFGAFRLARNKKGRSPADVARAQGHPGFLLLDELSLGDDLRMSSRQGKMEVMQGSLNRGALIDGVDEHGWTALHRAAFRGHVSIVNTLLDEGADVKAKDDAGYTSLHCAIESNHRDVIMLLLQHGALVDERTFSGHTTFDLATLYGYTDIASLLLDWVRARQGAEKGTMNESKLNERGGRSKIRTIQDNLDKNFLVDFATPGKSSLYAKDDVPLSLDRSTLTLTV